MASFWYFYRYLWTYFTPCSSVPIVNFEQVNTGWIQNIFLVIANWHENYLNLSKGTFWVWSIIYDGTFCKIVWKIVNFAKKNSSWMFHSALNTPLPSFSQLLGSKTVVKLTFGRTSTQSIIHIKESNFALLTHWPVSCIKQLLPAVRKSHRTHSGASLKIDKLFTSFYIP